MLSSETEQKVRQHLRLAKGLLETAVVGLESSEFDERNALSRAYYAMFHACCAWLACKYGIVRKLKHFELLDEMHRRRGRKFGDFVRDMRGMREASDYREEWKPQRRVTEDRLAKVESALGRLEVDGEINSMTSTELENVIRAKLGSSGLLQVVDEFKSQFLEFPEGFFVELVLTDGAKLVDVERIGREVRESLRKENIDLDVIVRAIWTVKEVGGPRPPADSSGNLQLGRWRVPVTLASGGLTQQVEVDVLYSVVLDLKNRIAGKGWSETSAIKEVVREFIEMELSLGGESYWDPIRDPKQEINGNALSYLFINTPVAQTLGIQS